MIILVCNEFNICKVLRTDQAHRKQYSKQTSVNKINKKLAHLPLLLRQIRKEPLLTPTLSPSSSPSTPCPSSLPLIHTNSLCFPSIYSYCCSDSHQVLLVWEYPYDHSPMTWRLPWDWLPFLRWWLLLMMMKIQRFWPWTKWRQWLWCNVLAMGNSLYKEVLFFINYLFYPRK